MRNRVLLAALVALIALTLACGPLSLGQQTSPTATPAAQPTKPPAAPATTVPATSVSPTAAPPAPTATKAAPAATVAPTAAPLIDFGSLWSDAQKKARTADRYRMGMSWIIGSTEDGKYTEAPFIIFEGYTVISDTYQVFTGGLLNELMGGAKIEMIDVGGKSYIKGSAMLGLMDPNKWYIMSDDSQSSAPLEPDDMFNMAGSGTGSGADAPKKTGTENLDGQSCDIWTWSFQNSAMLTGFLTDDDQKTDLSVIDKSEVKSWLCKDGYVHKVIMEISGHNKDDAKQKGGMKMESRMWDFGNPSLVVKAPEGAVPFGQ